jgi:D-alanyl-D-alanine dipeptidase
MAVSADPADDDAADAESGEDEPAPTKETVVTPGAGYVEKRVKVRTYGTTASDSKLLVAVPGTSGTKRLHALAAQALAAMSAAVQRDLGLELKLASGWRAHRWTSREQYEQVLVQRFGSVSEGKRWLAFDSPHETGLAIDIGVGGLKPSRASAEAQKRQPLHRWLIGRAWEFGFYPYKTEPWHWEFPMSLQAFKTGELGPNDPGPPEGALSFSTDDDEDDDALEDTDHEETPA